jgi:hypothetical protein
MSYFYVLMELGFSYDDQNHFPFGQGAGNPNRVFTNKKKAEEAAHKNNLEEFKKLIRHDDIREYGYNVNEVLEDSASEEDLLFEEGIFRILFGKSAEDWWDSLYDQGSSLKVEPTEEQWERLFKCFNLNFWEVVTVEKG